jgi:hypothetical protein
MPYRVDLHGADEAALGRLIELGAIVPPKRSSADAMHSAWNSRRACSGPSAAVMMRRRPVFGGSEISVAARDVLPEE